MALSTALLLAFSLLCICDGSQCTNSHPQHTLISVSVQGNSVKKIGINNYLSIVNGAIDAFLPSNSITAGLMTFGGTTSGPYFTSQQALTTTTSASIQSLITNLASNTQLFEDNHGNSVSSAMYEALTTLTSANAQKYNVIFTAGNPQQGGHGTATNASKVDFISGVTTKKANIQTFVVLIGTNGANFIKEFYSTLVENPAKDIIIIDPDNPDYTALTSRLCKSDGYDVKITEVKTDNGRFVEVLNRGATANIQLRLDGGAKVYSGCSTGQYCSIDTGYDVGLNSWSAEAIINGRSIDRLDYESTSTYFQAGIAARSFELRSSGFNNKYGANWRIACNPNESGTPGQGPIDCVAKADCGIGLLCAYDGQSAKSCDSTNTFCECSPTYFPDVNTKCIQLPTPTSCQAHVIKDVMSGEDYMYFSWDAVEFDGEINYKMIYESESSTSKLPSNCDSNDLSGCNVIDTGNMAAYPVRDYRKTGSDVYELKILTEYTAPFQNKVYSVDSPTLSCQSYTMNPTPSPTVPPTANPTTLSPTQFPSDNPTLIPTKMPTLNPSEMPSVTPTEMPTTTSMPSMFPSNMPTTNPSQFPTMEPTVLGETRKPSESPSQMPTIEPTTLIASQTTEDVIDDSSVEMKSAHLFLYIFNFVIVMRVF